MVIYFAYGSNMNPHRMKKREVFFTHRGRGILKGYTLKFNKTSSKNTSEGYANIVPEADAIVEGVIYTINDVGLLNLDKYEGYPEHYLREILPVKNDSGNLRKCETFIAQPDKIKNGLKPSKEYFGHYIRR